MTLPLRRLSRPRVCRMISSAWSQGTSFSRSVMLPATVSLVMMLRSVKSAMTFSTARTSTFWKLSDSFSPVYLPRTAARDGSADSGFTSSTNCVSDW